VQEETEVREETEGLEEMEAEAVEAVGMEGMVEMKAAAPPMSPSRCPKRILV
jgi:hypothetical protein